MRYIMSHFLQHFNKRKSLKISTVIIVYWKIQ